MAFTRTLPKRAFLYKSCAIVRHFSEPILPEHIFVDRLLSVCVQQRSALDTFARTAIEDSVRRWHCVHEEPIVAGLSPLV